MSTIHHLAIHHSNNPSSHYSSFQLSIISLSITPTIHHCTDLGACIAVDVIRITSPTHIVRLQYGHETGDQRGLLPTITAEYVQNAPGFLTKGSGPLWKEINDEDDGEDVCDGQDNWTEPVHLETVGETTQMWESEENTTRRDLMKIFEISGFMDDDFSDGDDETDAKLMMEEDGTELPSKKRKISDPEETLESTVPSLPSSLWRRVGRIEVCTLNCKQWSKRYCALYYSYT